MTNADIENIAKMVLEDVWHNRETIWGHPVQNKRQILCTEKIADYLGVYTDVVEDLGRHQTDSGIFEIAGTFDRRSSTISLSRKFPVQVMRFTAAHEIGHRCLHQSLTTLHRDRPIEGLSEVLHKIPNIEREANHFAACLLMPRNLVIKQFEQCFGVKQPLHIDDKAAFELCPSNPESLLYPERDLDQALAIASAEKFGSERFNSLAKQFGVSKTTMAIRLREINIVY
jgi:Zn-dependent peptidase ImmA (M78 family)